MAIDGATNEENVLLCLTAPPIKCAQWRWGGGKSGSLAVWQSGGARCGAAQEAVVDINMLLLQHSKSGEAVCTEYTIACHVSP